MSEKTKSSHTCVHCGQVDSFTDFVPEGSKYLCKKCYKKVKREIEKRDLGWNIRLKEEKEN